MNCRNQGHEKELRESTDLVAANIIFWHRKGVICLDLAWSRGECGNNLLGWVLPFIDDRDGSRLCASNISHAQKFYLSMPMQLLFSQAFF